MAGIKLQKRDDDFFMSYGHEDAAQIAPLVDLLRRTCRLRVWFDGLSGNAAQRSSELLGRAIGNARGALFCLSAGWRRSSWCRNEYDVALSEQRAHEGFEIVCARFDDVEPPEWLRVAEILDLRERGPGPVARLLRSLSSDVPHRFDNAEDVYLAAPWSRQSDLVRSNLVELHRAFRLVGDAPNLKHLGKDRIAAIQETTRGVIAVMPHDPSHPGIETSPFIVDEARIALERKKPLLLLVEPGAAPPEDLRKHAFRGAFTLTEGASGRSQLAALLEDFDESIHRAEHSDARAYIFWAGSLKGDTRLADDLAMVIERASNMCCVRGERLSAANVQRAIVERIRNAALVIADVSDDHRNTLIEAGIALGAGTQLRLMGSAPASGDFPKKRFMFEDQEVLWYRSPEEKLALAYSFAREFRRRVYVHR